MTDFTTLYLLHWAFLTLKDQAMMCCVLPEYLLNAVRSLNPHAKQVLMQKNDDNISFTDAVHALAVRSWSFHHYGLMYKAHADWNLILFLCFSMFQKYVAGESWMLTSFYRLFYLLIEWFPLFFILCFKNIFSRYLSPVPTRWVTRRTWNRYLLCMLVVLVV